MVYQTAMDDPTVLLCLADHLSVGDLFRLRRALGRAGREDTLWPAEVALLVAARMGLLCPSPAAPAMHLLGARMRTTHRCVECGARTRRVVRVCVPCASDPACPVAMVTRQYLMRQKPTRLSVRALLLRVRTELRVTFVASSGALHYWKRDADALLGHGA